jgi:hypothetical protein
MTNHLFGRSVAALITVALVLSACGKKTDAVLARVPSPDQKLEAVLVQVDYGGGATVGFGSYVYLNRAGDNSRKSAQFEAYSCGLISLSWIDNNTFQVSYEPHCHVLRFDNEWWDRSAPETLRIVELVLRRQSPAVDGG